MIEKAQSTMKPEASELEELNTRLNEHNKRFDGLYDRLEGAVVRLIGTWSVEGLGECGEKHETSSDHIGYLRNTTNHYSRVLNDMEELLDRLDKIV